MDVEDALELLSPTFTHPSVRKYAVCRLRQAEDEVGFFIFYLLTLSHTANLQKRNISGLKPYAKKSDLERS